MYKWIMAILFFGACLLGVILLTVTSIQEAPGDKHETAPVPAVPAVQLDAAAAEAVYKKSCVACHGDQLQGAMGPNLQKVGTKYTKEQLYKIIWDGRGGMPAFKGSLKEEEVANLSLWLLEHK